MRVVVARSRAIARTLAGQGGMMSVAVPAARAEELLAACGDRRGGGGGQRPVVGGGGRRPRRRWTSWPAAARPRACGRAGSPVDYASHTAQVEPIRDELATALAGIVPTAAQIPFFSTVTADWAEGTDLDAGYWYRNLRQTVRFAEAIAALAAQGFRAFVEVSPHPVLVPSMQDTLEPADPTVVVGTLRRDDGGLTRFSTSLAELHVGGVDVDWRPPSPAPAPGASTCRPTPSSASATGSRRVAQSRDLASAGLAPTDHPLLGATVALADGEGIVFTGRLSPGTQPWLADHAVSGTVAGAGHRAGRAGAAGRRRGRLRPVLEELTLEAPLVLGAGGVVQVQVTVSGRRGRPARRSRSTPGRASARTSRRGRRHAARHWRRHAETRNRTPRWAPGRPRARTRSICRRVLRRAGRGRLRLRAGVPGAARGLAARRRGLRRGRAAGGA